MLAASVRLLEPAFVLQSIPGESDVIFAKNCALASVPLMNSGDGFIDRVNIWLLRGHPVDGS